MICLAISSQKVFINSPLEFVLTFQGTNQIRYGKKQPTNLHSKPSTNLALLIMIVERGDIKKKKNTKLVKNLTNKELFYLRKTKLSFSKFLNTHQSNRPSASCLTINI